MPRRAPSACSARAIGSQSSGRGTPTRWRAGPRGIQQRTEDVENRPLAALGAKFPRGRNVFERRMKIRREKKRETVFPQRVRRVRRRQVHPDAEFLDHIRAADRGGHGAVAVLGHGHAGGGAQDGGGGGNVERAQLVAAGADHVEDFARLPPVLFDRRRNGFLPQRGGEGGDFLRRLAFLRERDEEFRLRFGGNFFIRQLADGALNLLDGQRLPAGELSGENFEHGFYGHDGNCTALARKKSGSGRN